MYIRDRAYKMFRITSMFLIETNIDIPKSKNLATKPSWHHSWPLKFKGDKTYLISTTSRTISTNLDDITREVLFFMWQFITVGLAQR